MSEPYPLPVNEREAYRSRGGVPELHPEPCIMTNGGMVRGAQAIAADTVANPQRMGVYDMTPLRVNHDLEVFKTVFPGGCMMDVATEEYFALKDVLAERKRQYEKFGDQSHNAYTWLAILGEEVGEANQAALQDTFGGKHAGTLREELVHAAAVALAFIQDLDRKNYVQLKRYER